MGAEGQRGRGAVDDVDGSLDKKTPLTSTNFCSKSRPCRVDRESKSSRPNSARTQPPGNEFARWMTPPPPPPPPSLTVHVANRGLPGSRQGIIPRRASDIEISRTFIVQSGASPEKTIAPSRLARSSGLQGNNNRRSGIPGGDLQPPGNPHPPRQRQHHHVPFVCVLRLACCCCGAHQCHRVSALTKGEGGGGGRHGRWGLFHFRAAMPCRREEN